MKALFMNTERYSFAENPTIFGKILRKELPADIVYEDETVLAFRNLYPQAPIHILIIPKQHVTCIRALEPQDTHLVIALLNAANLIAEQLGVKESGYRLLTNAGEGGGQTIFHLHFHLLADPSGAKLPGF